jgi:hypothetical protein
MQTDLPREREYRQRLKAMIEPGQQTWDLSEADVAALTWAQERLAALEERCRWLEAARVPPPEAPQ